VTEIFIWILIIISATIWQIALAYRIFYKRPINVVHKSETVKAVEERVTPTQTKNKIGVVDVGVAKKLKIEKVDGSSIKSDETIKGKVKTKKDQLRALRNG
tara:strand:- start:397 stop:699 length:303 start_codon:yes stop_codon:yes gene_type:complete